MDWDTIGETPKCKDIRIELRERFSGQACPDFLVVWNIGRRCQHEVCRQQVAVRFRMFVVESLHLQNPRRARIEAGHRRKHCLVKVEQSRDVHALGILDFNIVMDIVNILHVVGKFNIIL